MMNEIEHLLVCLMEECAEVQHAVAKALRFGLDDQHPKRDNKSNEELINEELVDLFAVVAMLSKRDVIKHPGYNDQGIYNKTKKVLDYMELAKANGALEPNKERTPSPPVPLRAWANVYSTWKSFHASKENAEANAGPTAIRIAVPISE